MIVRIGPIGPKIKNKFCGKKCGTALYEFSFRRASKLLSGVRQFENAHLHELSRCRDNHFRENLIAKFFGKTMASPGSKNFFLDHFRRM